MYEFINLTCFSGLVAGAIVLRRPQYRSLWVFLLVPVLILLTVSGRWLYTNAAPVMPALQSYWLPIHVSVVSLGSGVFLVAGISSILFLLRTSRLGDPETEGALARVVQRFPDAQTLDRIAYRTTIFAFPVFGFGVIFGAIWAEEAWGRYWAGIQGDGVFRRVGGVRGVSARQINGGVAGQEGGVDQRRGIRGHDLQPVLR